MFDYKIDNFSFKVFEKMRDLGVFIVWIQIEFCFTYYIIVF
jgi:hypothetical protein